MAIDKERAATALADSLIDAGYSKAEFRDDIIAIQTLVMTAIFDELINYGVVSTVVEDSGGVEIGTGTGGVS
jgi:mannitol/fructose-specific phosphotransferase system IIA component (Ntr-type)